ncbi:MAG: FAD-dependent oxidoreductase [Candidatus Omnitrophica bacterium]|nr:FAD-dependent oxidoreductase [Candidatus Omnitrophota bacterium]
MSVLILGAGLSGLSVAGALKCDYEIVEKNDTCGGLCRSSCINGFTFDMAGHVLHFKDSKNFIRARDLLGKNIVSNRRDSRVWMRDSIIAYPFQHNFLKASSKIADECLDGLRKARRGVKGKPAKSDRTFKSWIFETFGHGIARHFMVPYNEKLWLYPLETLSAQWAKDLVPVPRLKDLHARHEAGNIGYNARFWYPRSGGMQALVRALEKRIKKVKTACRPMRLDLEKKEAILDDGSSFRFSKLVSTIPLPELCEMIRPMPSRVEKAFSKLKYVSVFNVNLGISGAVDSDAHWIYFPQKDIIFYRMGIPSNFCRSLAPAGCSSLSFEISYSKDFPIDKKRSIDRILSDCKKAGFAFAGSDILALDIQDIKYAYCIYDNQREKALKVISDHLKEYDCFLAGRYGAWQYSSMEDCMVEAVKIARMVST